MPRWFVTLVLVLALPSSPSAARTAPPGPAKTAHPAAPPAPTNLRVPPLAVDEKSLLLVWEKPADYATAEDYAVYQNGKRLGTATKNHDQFSPAKKYFDAFYEADPARFHTRIQLHNFTVAGLKPNTKYTFTVRTLDRNGRESVDSNRVIQKTTPPPKVVNIVDHGAKGDGRTLDTAAIQSAIDACPKQGKVLVPKGIWLTGALFLKSDMTLQIAEGAILRGTDAPEEYPLSKGYRLYPYAKFDRPPALLNLLAPGRHEPGTFANVRIVGPGTLDGNGWKRAKKPTSLDELGGELPVFQASNSRQVLADGILAKAQFEKGVSEGLNAKIAYGQRRSSLLLLRGARGVYLGDLTVMNPAFHGIMVLESEAVTIAGVTHLTYDANNADGIEFGNGRDGLVINNVFDTGDDAVNFAAGTGRDAAKQAPQQDTWIFNNYFRRGHGAVVVGSHTGAWIQGIRAEDNVAVGTDVGLRCKSTAANGGGGRDILFRDNALKDLAKQAFVFTLEYKDENAANDYASAPRPAQFRDITVRNVTVDGVRGDDGAIVVKGDTERNAFHEKLTFDRVVLRRTPPIFLSDLKDSVLRDITFPQWKGGGKAIVIKRTEGVRFEGTTPKP